MSSGSWRSPDVAGPARDLGGLRDEIDRIDAAIVGLIAERLNVCRDVASLKESTGASVIQPSRVRDVLRTRTEWALEAGVDPEFAEQIFRTLLAETHRIEVADTDDVAAPEKAAATTVSDLDTVACRIDHVVVAVEDLDAAGDFFGGLGFSVSTTDDPQMHIAEAGGVTVVLVGADHDPAVRRRVDEHGAGIQHMAIEVLNAGFTRDALDAAGIPRLTDVVVDNGGHEQFFAAVDPASGVQLSFISRTGHRVPLTSHNVRALFAAINGGTR